MTEPLADADCRTALELIAECVARVRMTDPADTAAAMLAAWHGFGTAQAAGTLLAQDNIDDSDRHHTSSLPRIAGALDHHP